MKLTNMKITPKLGILVGVTLLGLCAAGVLAGYLMQREMLDARLDQTKAIVEMGLNMAAGLKKQVQEGNVTAMIWVTKTVGKHRGYVERSEITGANGGPIEHADVKQLLIGKFAEAAADPEASEVPAQPDAG